MLIKDLVSIDEHGSFRSDVQLSDYDYPKLNLELLRNYIFTGRTPLTGGPGRDSSAIDVLDMLKTAFSTDRFENRMVLTANYGHGKSHLALVLANFFARPVKSEEVQIIFKRLEQAINNPATLSGFREFKQTKGEFLVIRLRGDGFEDLQEGFLYALEQSLKEHECTRGIEIPFWYSPAVNWLNRLSGEDRRKVEMFLANYNTDLASLCQDIRKSGAYELVREAFKHLTGAYPDFGREVSLKDLVLWAVDEVCVPNKMGGLLILFDEFSLFLQKYVVSRAAGKLQDLLNGISDRLGKSAFLAFTQIDLDNVVDTYAQGSRRDDVRRELDRLPKNRRNRLFSLMESVLDSYLKQDDIVWEEWMKRHPIRATMTRNREMLLNYFSQRYETNLRWSLEQIQETIIKGCYPLHPLTAAILSNHTFEAGTGENPRTALHFLRDRWEKGLPQQPAERADGTPNFVFAIELVDFFGEQISKPWYDAYQTALKSTPSSLNEEHHTALKALLLQQAVSNLERHKARGNEQLELLSALSGLSVERLKEVLRELSNNRVIDYDPYLKYCSLPPSGMRSPETGKIIEEAVQKIPIDRSLLDEIAKSIPTLEVPLQFGNASDWAPRQIILTEEFFTSETIKSLLSRYKAGINGIEEGVRGLVIWLLAQTEEEKMRLRQNAQKILDDALRNDTHPLPVVILLPRHPNPALLQSARRIKAIENLNQNDREKIGTIGRQNELNRALSDFKFNFRVFFDPDHYADLPRQFFEYALPAVYRTSIVAKEISLRDVLSQIYRHAYKYRVEFYTQYPVIGRGPNWLREAVKKVTLGLFSDEIAGTLGTLGNQDIQAQIIRTYLPVKWGLLSAQTYTIQPPTSLALLEAWNRLEETFTPGCRETRAHEVLLELLNPPFGHDYNTLTLLLAAWIGYHRHEIRISLNGRLISLENFKNYFDETRGPKDFLDRLVVTAPLAISRINADEMFAEADAILEQIRQNRSFSISQAQQALAKLQQAQNNPRLSPERSEAIESYAPRLIDAISAAQNYDDQALKFLNELSHSDFDGLLSLRASLEKLTLPALVSPTQPVPERLLESWVTKVKQELEIFCKKYSELRDLSDYKSNQERLQKAHRQLKDYPALQSVVEDALSTLDQHRDQLKQTESEKSIRDEIKTMASSAGLADLYHYRSRLAEFNNLSPQTEQLRQEKIREIERRIQQFEQLEELLSQAIGTANSLTILRQQRETLLRNLDQVANTSLHQSLVTLKEKTEWLEKFFEQLIGLDSMPNQTPQEIATFETKIHDLETEFRPWLSPMQIELLNKKKQQISEIRQRKTEEARQWLRKLEDAYETGGNIDDLQRKVQNPPAFLPAEELAKLEQLKQIIQKKIEEDLLLKIEILFGKLGPDARRECLQRLQSLIDKP